MEGGYLKWKDSPLGTGEPSSTNMVHFIEPKAAGVCICQTRRWSVFDMPLVDPGMYSAQLYSGYSTQSTSLFKLDVINCNGQDNN